ncbi:MAG: hypothetical protein HOC78_01350 [Candidatus Komeilibacteria bacterium]|jgi:hypothetical protein|nr:hypothetical protein [Candidatus Komeilibacteria bacterium]
MSKEDKKKKQAIDKAFVETLKKIDRVKNRVKSNIVAKRESKEQEQIDNILTKIKKDL